MSFNWVAINWNCLCAFISSLPKLTDVVIYEYRTFFQPPVWCPEFSRLSVSGTTHVRRLDIDRWPFCSGPWPPNSARTGFQIDTLKPRCDWLTLSQSFPHWLTSPSSRNQFENPPQRHLMNTKFIPLNSILILIFYFQFAKLFKNSFPSSSESSTNRRWLFFPRFGYFFRLAHKLKNP